MEGNGHDSVRGVESFLDAIAVVDIDVDIKYALVESEKFEDAENNVCGADAMLGLLHERGMISSRKRTVHITETAGFRLLCVMESSRPIDSDITFVPA